MTKHILIGILATLLTFGLFGTAFAADWGMLHQDRDSFGVLLNASDHQDPLAKVYIQQGSEAGHFTNTQKMNSDRGEVATNDRTYIRDGSEAGDWLIKCSSC